MDNDLTQILRQVKRIELRTRQAMNDLTAGAYKSRFRGQGMEFEEVREYAIGDDVRSIDWNVSARAGKPFVKVFREERELTVMLLVDLSGSMQFGAIPGLSPRNKMAAAAEAAAVVGVTAMQNKDKIGLIGFHNETAVHLPARRGRNHTMRLLREILSQQSSHGQTNIAHAIDELNRVSRKRTVCFIISDFLAPLDQLGETLQRARRRHDVVGLRIADKNEAQLPNDNAPLLIQDPEGRQVISASNNKSTRRRYQEAYQQQRETCQKAFRSAACDLVDIDTSESCIAAIQSFFRKRRSGK